MNLERGSLLNKRYRIVEILGQGGMGSIYRAVDENLGVDVAVKENLFTTDEYARQFRREAVILANLRHSNLPRVTDHFVINGQGQYLVMDFIEGEDLRERMDRDGLLSDEETVILGIAICDALDYLHSRKPKVVHRDIKPGNVKVSPSGHITLVDFGLAKVLQGSQMTSTGARAMTPGYSPPEQYGTARTDHRTDIYSLGATLYVALTGVLPEDALMRAMGQAELTPIRKHNPKVSRRLSGVVEKALELRPEDRYQNAQEFKAALLKSKAITSRRRPDDLTLTPTPEIAAVGEKAVKDNSHAPPAIYKAGGPHTPSAEVSDISTPLIPISTPILEPVSQPYATSRGTRWGCLISTVIAGVLVGSILGIYYLRPSLFNELSVLTNPVVAFLRPPGLTNTPMVEVPGVVKIETPMSSATPMDKSTDTPVLKFTNSPLPTTTSVLIPRSTDTPTLTITPVGGGRGEIAFASNRLGLPQIWVMKADGTAKHQITDMPEGACQPSWSPDGLQLVFISPCAFNQETYPGASLFIINYDSTGLQPLPTMPGGDFDPDWGPDGNRIVFTSLRDYNRAQVYVMDLNDNTVTSLSNNTVSDAQPAWSPDGNEVAFVSTRRGPFQIWIMSDNGEDQVLFSRSGSLKDTHPVWSPDGMVILYTQSEVLGGVPRMVAARFEGESFTEKRVIPEIIPMREGVYSPDGFWITYEGWPDGSNHDIYIMTTNGLGRQQLTEDPALDFDPAWRPVISSP
jgi:serine/threonine protein kinase